MKEIKIIIAGPRGRMGREALELIHNTPHFSLVGAVDRKNDGLKIADIDGLPPLDAPIFETLEGCLQQVVPDVLLDLTTPEVGRKHTRIALEHGVRPVIGTTGFSTNDLDELGQLAQKKELGAIIAPNFAVGAVLMMKFSQMAAKYFQDVEIIELHHDQKLDAPSGTGIKTAEMIAVVREPKKQGHPDEAEHIEGARGADYEGIRLHSVRLPGLIAHQEVLFGGDGQTLTIKHDSYNRASFMSGVKLAIETVMKVDLLVYGLENIME
jgi:4-hydroxy-tetrahydrodipicolinate reductase